MLILLQAVSASTNLEASKLFHEFIATHQKSYSSSEYDHRLGIFQENMNRVNALNAEQQRLGGEDAFGVTQFSDLSPEEFKAKYLQDGASMATAMDSSEPITLNGVTFPGDIDWRPKGGITAVKNQGSCSCGWAFSAIQAIESYGEIAGKGLQTLAPSQLVECDKTSKGCEGGSARSALNFLVANGGGVMREVSYPYRNGDKKIHPCAYNQTLATAMKVTGHRALAPSEPNLLQALALGPPSVGVASSVWQHYVSNVLVTCPGTLDHYAQVVGVVQSPQLPYWIVRNSWGSTWGESGYIKVKFGINLCGISNNVTIPVVL